MPRPMPSPIASALPANTAAKRKTPPTVPAATPVSATRASTHGPFDPRGAAAAVGAACDENAGVVHVVDGDDGDRQPGAPGQSGVDATQSGTSGGGGWDTGLLRNWTVRRSVGPDDRDPGRTRRRAEPRRPHAGSRVPPGTPSPSTRPRERTVAPQQAGPSDSGDYRIEHDSMGEVRVPTWAKWRAQTQRAVENFPISGTPIERELIGALAAIKGAAATVNADLGVLDADIAAAITEAATRVTTGEFDEHFPIDVFQTGSGTSSNMNTNEVIATLATEALGAPVHPNDHVNASQSSNDVFPSAIHVAATGAIVRELIPALQHLELALSRKADEFAEVVKSGRTHLMDATPVTLGQEFGGYAATVRYGIERLRASL